MQISDGHEFALQVIGYVFGSISFVCLVLTVVALLFLRYICVCVCACVIYDMVQLISDDIIIHIILCIIFKLHLNHQNTLGYAQLHPCQPLYQPLHCTAHLCDCSGQDWQ